MDTIIEAQEAETTTKTDICQRELPQVQFTAHKSLDALNSWVMMQ